MKEILFFMLGIVVGMSLLCLLTYYKMKIVKINSDQETDKDLFYKAIAERIVYNCLDIEMMKKYEERIDHIEEEEFNQDQELLKKINELNRFIEYLENDKRELINGMDKIEIDYLNRIDILEKELEAANDLISKLT